MSNDPTTPATQVLKALKTYEAMFNQQSTYGLMFQQEAMFAKQHLLKNDYTLTAARNNESAFRAAILNVAAIGISLNPALAYAYLVPRKPDRNSKPQIYLDISYRGLVYLGCQSGAIKWAKAELVYEGDEFEWRDMTTLPHHKPLDAFADHTTLDGLLGGYCVVQLADGSYLVDRMSAAEILKVKATSMAANGPWKTWPTEMAKKTLVKRAAKSWPQGTMERLASAIHTINEHEGIEIEGESRRVPDSADVPALPNTVDANQLQDLRNLISKAGIKEPELCARVKLERLEDLPASRYQPATNYLNTLIAKEETAA